MISLRPVSYQISHRQGIGHMSPPFLGRSWWCDFSPGCSLLKSCTSSSWPEHSYSEATAFSVREKERRQPGWMAMMLSKYFSPRPYQLQTSKLTVLQRLLFKYFSAEMWNFKTWTPIEKDPSREGNLNSSPLSNVLQRSPLSQASLFPGATSPSLLVPHILAGGAGSQAESSPTALGGPLSCAPKVTEFVKVGKVRFVFDFVLCVLLH